MNHDIPLASDHVGVSADRAVLRRTGPAGAGTGLTVAFALSAAFGLALPGAAQAQSGVVTAPPAFMTAHQTPLANTGTGGLEVYGVAGFPGVGLGLGVGINDRFGLRGQYTTLGSQERTFTESNIEYTGKLRSDMLGLYLDGFVAGGFRVTGGLSINDLRVRGNGVPVGNGTVTINGVTVGYGPGDTLSMEATTPNVAPYLGIGYGHSPNAKGWSFSFDAGIHFAKFTAKVDASQGIRDKLTAAGRNAQADIDAEQAKVQDKFDKLPFWPAILIGISYRF